jgi:hypothetical protein
MPYEVGQPGGANAPFRVADSLEGALAAAKAMMDEGGNGIVQITDTQTGDTFDEEAILELIEQQKDA